MSRPFILLGLYFLPCLAILSLLGCRQQVKLRNALLPPGLEQAQVPDADLSLFVYISPQEPLVLERGGQLFQVERLYLWAGSSPDSFGILADFVTPEQAARAYEQVEEGQSVWEYQEGDRLFSLYGRGPWVETARQSVLERRFVNVLQQYPEIREALRLLPEHPPLDPVAVGFARTLNQGLVEAIGRRTGLALEELGPALRVLRIGSLVFAAYSNSPLQVRRPVDEVYLREKEIGILMIASTALPGVVLSPALNVFAGQANLQQVDLGNTTAYYTSLGMLHLLLQNQGSLLYLAVAPTRELGEALLRSELGP